MSDDYQHAIDEIRRCLDPRDPKAAAMVGAGFSLNANPVGVLSRPFPSWRELTGLLAERLYPDKKQRESVLKEAGATSAALRLAQEFQVAFGRAALVDFVRDSVRDPDFLPGKAHDAFLKLPWSDVFTTNYDTLLERAAQRVWQRKYDVVQVVGDLPIACRPRIVKLHGSLPELCNLVLTEDDYRRYTRAHAPFVNAAQASLAENVFCLVGFSGNDPNFLAWTGWLRDELQDSTPYIYLFTTDDLKPFQRRLLEDRRVIPIPIVEVSGEKSPVDAYHWLFKKLRSPLGPPAPTWNTGPGGPASHREAGVAKEPPQSRSEEPSDWINAAMLWRRHRLHYKGWHVLYRQGIERIWAATSSWVGALSPEVASQWSPPQAILILRELAWRCARALRPLPDDVVFELIDPALVKYKQWRATNEDSEVTIHGDGGGTSVKISELDDCALSVRLELLRHAREIGNLARFESVDGETEQILGGLGRSASQDARQFVEHQRVLLLLAKLDEEGARSRLENWDTPATDPVWAVRRAGLCLECGLLERGKSLLLAVLDSLRHNPARRDADVRALSLEGLSLRLWSYWTSSEEIGTRCRRPGNHAAKCREAIETSRNDSRVAKHPSEDEQRAEATERLRHLQGYGCDPGPLLDWLELLNALPATEPLRESKEESFDVGAVTTRYSADLEQARLTHAYQAIRFIEETGLPLQIKSGTNLAVAGKLFANAARAIAILSSEEAVGLVLRSADPSLLSEFLSRKRIAALSAEQVSFLADAARLAIQQALRHLGPPRRQGQAEDGWWASRFQAACAVLGRVAVRLGDNQLLDLLKVTISLPSDRRIRGRVTGAGELADLIRRCCESLSLSAIAELLPTILRTPVLGSDLLPRDSCKTLGGWYDPVQSIGDHPEGCYRRLNLDLDAQVAALVRDVRDQGGEWRKNSVSRMAWLGSEGLLSESDQETFVEALFAQTDTFGFPADTGRPSTLILNLPRFPKTSEKRLFKSMLIDHPDQPVDWHVLKRTVNRFPTSRRFPVRSVSWSPGDLDVILDRAGRWWQDSKPALVAPRSKTAMSRIFGGWSGGGNYSAYTSWLDTLEEVVLLASNATRNHLEIALTLIREAEQAGLTTARVASSLCFRCLLEQATAEARIRRALGSRDERDVAQGCDGIIRWCGHVRENRRLAVPVALLTMLSVMIETRRHEKLSLLLRTATAIIEAIEPRQIPTDFMECIIGGLRLMLIETPYDFSQSPFTTETRIRLRADSAELARVAVERGLESEVFREWLEAARRDMFPEVRREVP